MDQGEAIQRGIAPCESMERIALTEVTQCFYWSSGHLALREQRKKFDF